jgi:hypothetical protein
MGNNQLPMKPIPITKEAVKAKATSELTRLNYQNLLKELVSIKVQPDNLVESQEKMKAAKKIEKAIDELRTTEKKVWDDNAKIVQESFMEFLTPLRSEIARLGTDVGKVNAAQLAEKKRIDDENNRTLSVRAAIQGFINKTILEISDARTDIEIVRIQKLIGTEKSRKNYYGDLMPELETACEALTPKINVRKEDIRKRTDLQQKSEVALQSGDIQTATDIKEAAEILDHKMDEDVLRLQDAAFEAASSIEVALTESTVQTVKGRRLWRWRVDDLSKLAKKRPDLIKIEPNSEAIEALLSEKRNDGSLDKVDEMIIDGLVFYIKPSY